MKVLTRNIISYILVYIALCILILLVFGWLIYINPYFVIAIWLFNTLVYLAFFLRYRRSSKT